MFNEVESIKMEEDLYNKEIDDMIKNGKLFIKDSFFYRMYLSTVTTENDLRSMQCILSYKDTLFKKEVIK